jgi:hypothetical protein
MKLIQIDSLAASCRIQPDRDGDEPKGQKTFPNGRGHAGVPHFWDSFENLLSI